MSILVFETLKRQSPKIDLITLTQVMIFDKYFMREKCIGGYYSAGALPRTCFCFRLRGGQSMV